MVICTARALGICLMLLSLGAGAAEKRLDRSFPVSAGGQLTLDVDASDISVSGTDSDQVVVHATLYGSESQLERAELSAQAEGNDVTVTMKQGDSDWRSWLWMGRDGGKISIEVPRQYNLALQTSFGHLTISGLQGAARGKTGAGNIRLTQLRGAVALQTDAGSIDGEALEGDIEVQNSGGEIRLRNVGGKVRAHASSGDIILTEAHGEVALQSARGNIQAQAIDGAISAHTAAGNVDTQLSGANRGIQVSAAGGDIVLRMPSTTAAQLDASAGGGTIHSDLLVATHEVARDRLRGQINLGGPLIRAQTAGGNISLRAE